MPYRVCAQCGVEFPVPSPTEWMYRKRNYGKDERGKKGLVLYFCTRTCERRWREDHPNKKEYNRWGRQ